MADSSKSLEELKLLWESDPSSKVYLQLARAYRESGELDAAIEVLETSLEHRPRDPRGRVALARCHIDAGRPAPAAELLEEVIRLDAAHVDANKLLLECYLRLGDAEKAEERLNIYKLLNDRDPELDHLEYRLRSIGSEEDEEAAADTSVPEPAPVQPAADPTPIPEPPPVETPEEPPALEATPEPPPVETPPEIPPVEATPEAVSLDDVSEPEAVTEPEPEPEREMEAESETVSKPEPEPEPEPVDELFDLGPQEAEPGDEPALFELWEQTETVTPEPSAPEPAPAEPAAAGAVAEAELNEEPADEPEEAATATLGRLYLRQGHLEEAEGIFREVLRRDPEHAEARRGLEEVAAARAEATPSAPPASPPEAEPIARMEPPEPAVEPEPEEIEPEPEPEHEPELEPEPVAKPVPEPESPKDEAVAPAGRALDGRTLLSRVAMDGALPADATGRKIAVLQQYLKHLRSAEPDHVH